MRDVGHGRWSVGWATLLSPLLHERPPTKTSFGTDGKKQLSMPTNDLQKLFLGMVGGGGAKHAFVATIGDRSVAGPSRWATLLSPRDRGAMRDVGHGRWSVGWATLLSPLLHERPLTKTSFGTDGKKQVSFPTNDLQKRVLRSRTGDCADHYVGPLLSPHQR